MIRNKTFLFVVFLFFSFSAFPQQTAIYTNNLADYNRALELYNNQQYLAAQTLFRQIRDEVEDESLKANVAYYVANAAVRLGQPGADKRMQNFVERYPTSTKRNSAFLDVADFYFDTGKYSLARRWYDRVDQTNLSRKELERFYFNNGYTYFKTRKKEEAKKYFSKVQNSNKYGSQAKYYLGFIAYESDDYSEADQYFEEVGGDKRYSEDVSYFKSDMNFKNGNFQIAIDQALEQLPRANRLEKSELNKIIGESYFNLGEYEKAIPYLKQYHGQRGKWTNTDYYQLGYAYYKQGDYEEAIAEFNKIIDGKNSISQNAYYHLAQSYLNSDKKQQALNAFKNASEMEYDEAIQADAALNYAKLSYEIGNSYTSVPQVLMNYLQKYPHSEAKTEIQKLLVDAFITSKNYEEAMELLKSNKEFKNSEVLQQVAFYRGIELYHNGDYREALDAFNQSLETRRNQRFTALATFWKAETDFELRNFDEALVGYKEFSAMRAAEGASEKENLDYNIAYVYFKQKNYSRAIEYFKKYVNAPGHDKVRQKDALIRLGDTYFVNSNYWPAIETYQKVVELHGVGSDYAAFQKAISYGFINRNEDKISNLTQFLTQFPRSAYKADALYELGNTYGTMENISSAIASYDRLTGELPKSPLVPKALLKEGLLYYNTNRGNEAINRFKKVVAQYPNSPESIQAVKTARLIYIDLGRTDEYAAWIKNIDFVEASDADLDTTTFEAAQKQYQENNPRAEKAFEKYLASFPNGLHALESHFYLAQLYFQNDKKKESISHYQQVLQSGNTEFTERALAKLSQIYLENRNYSEAVPLLERLEDEAGHSQNVVFAQSNLMKSYLELGNTKQAESYAEKVLQNPEIDDAVKSDAKVIVARVAMKTGNETKAKKAYAEVQKIATGELAAEALYYDAYFMNKDGKYEESNDAVQKLAKNYSTYKLFGAKGLLLMAQNFYQLKDAYQATYILDNVITNFSQFPEVVQQAKSELKKIKAQEAKTNASVNETNQN